MPSMKEDCGCLTVISKAKEKRIKAIKQKDYADLINSHSFWDQYCASHEARCSGNLSAKRRKHIEKEVKQLVNQCKMAADQVRAANHDLTEQSLICCLKFRAEQPVMGRSNRTASARLLSRTFLLDHIKKAASCDDLFESIRLKRSLLTFPL